MRRRRSFSTSKPSAPSFCNQSPRPFTEDKQMPRKIVRKVYGAILGHTHRGTFIAETQLNLEAVRETHAGTEKEIETARAECARLSLAAVVAGDDSESGQLAA